MSMGNSAEPESSQTYDVSTATAIANLFNRYFTSVFNSDHDNLDERSSPPSSPPSTSGQ
jgi:hypothetical protein